MATIDKILRKSNFAAAMTALIAKLNSLFVRKETGKGLSTKLYFRRKSKARRRSSRSE